MQFMRLKELKLSSWALNLFVNIYLMFHDLPDAFLDKESASTVLNINSTHEEDLKKLYEMEMELLIMDELMSLKQQEIDLLLRKMNNRQRLMDKKLFKEPYKHLLN